MRLTSAHRNLKLLCLLRSIAIAGQTVAILTVTRVLQIPLETTPLWAIIGALAIVNIATWWRIRTAAAIIEAEFFAQLMMDITALFGLLYFSGGATNPFATLFILQVIIAAVALKPAYTWMVATTTIIFYTLLMIWHVEVPYFQHHHLGDFFSLHVQGMWISFILLATIIAGFVVRMNRTIRRQDALLAEAEKMAAIGALAANAAHELGTPLATLFLLAESTGTQAPALQEQLLRCKNIISRITAAGGVVRAEGGMPIPLDQFLQTVAEQWQSDHPGHTLTIAIAKNAAPRIVGELGVAYAIRNLLDNAADASPDAIHFAATWTAQNLTITIEDRGAGISPVIADTLGNPGVTTKPDGMGMGIFLTRSVVTRLEGTLDLRPAAQGGTVATMTLPLHRLAL
jgi:two-component system sensor histidine kinase RegB